MQKKVRGDKKTATAAEKGPMGKIKLAHAVKGNIRVYLTVDGKYWCECTKKRHPAFKQIMEKVKDDIMSKRLTKDMSKIFLQETIDAWPIGSGKSK